MSTGPASDLARLRVHYGARWRIVRQDSPLLFIAVNRSTARRLHDTSAGGLASMIQTAETRPVRGDRHE